MTDLCIHNIGQLVTCAGGDLTIIEGGAVTVEDGIITAVGPKVEAAQTIDAGGRAVVPGFVDCHTHAVWAGDRVDEFERKMRGEPYMEILKAGGGIASTARAVRGATLNQLVDLAAPRLRAMLAQGTTTVEIKSGYGLTPEAEMGLLEAIAALSMLLPQTITPTFLGAHAVPAGHDAASYTAEVIDEMLPKVAAWAASPAYPEMFRLPPSVDVFCEEGVFTVAQSRRILQAAQAHGFTIKAHVDEFVALGGTPMAVELGALSVDHLDVTPPEHLAQLAASATVGVLLPAVNFHLGTPYSKAARTLLDEGGRVALATDLNPGSAPCYGMPFVMALAVRHLNMTPAEALLASTINGGHALGLADVVGSIEVGKRADLLILSEGDYRHLCYQFGVNIVERVIVGGAVMTSPPSRFAPKPPLRNYGEGEGDPF